MPSAKLAESQTSRLISTRGSSGAFGCGGASPAPGAAAQPARESQRYRNSASSPPENRSACRSRARSASLTGSPSPPAPSPFTASSRDDAAQIRLHPPQRHRPARRIDQRRAVLVHQHL